MTPERYQQIKHIYLEARNLSGAARAACLIDACAGDAELRAEVERYLADEVEATTFLQSIHLTEVDEQPSVSVGPATPAPSPEQIGRYRILRKIGEGGMGVVYEAEQDRTRQRVALKLINPGVASPEALRRFELEARVLGRLQHPGIARIFDADTFDAGVGPQPFFAMELVDGQPLNEYANVRQLDVRERLELVARAADAIQHAHQRGVIHRDLKPGNILVVAEGVNVPRPKRDIGQPKILDFGVARVTDGDIQATRRTDVGQLIGTIPYMSPEQAAGTPEELDTRSDVYSLGVVAFELLAGRLPYDLTRKLVHEAVRIIREEEPSSLGGGRRSSPTGSGTHGRRYDRDVETIIGKALEKDRTRRYQSASDLANDIRRYLADEPIAARPPSAAYQVRKFARRNKALAAGMIIAVCALAAGFVVSTGMYLRAEAAADRERRAAAIAQAHASFVRHMLASANPAVGSGDAVQKELVGRSVRVVDVLPNATHWARQSFANAPEAEAAVLRTIGETYFGLGLYADAQNALKRASGLLESLSSTEVPDRAMLGIDLAQALQARGQSDEALLLGRSSLSRLQAAAPRYAAERAEALTALGEILCDRRENLAEAERYFRDAEQLLDRNDPRYSYVAVGVHAGLGTVAVSRRDWAAGEKEFRRALALSREKLGETHGFTIAVLNNYAYVLAQQGKAEDAGLLYEENLRKARNSLGEDHPNVAWLLNNLAYWHRDLGEHEEAERFQRDALAIRQKKLGEDHDLTVQSKRNLAEAMESVDNALGKALPDAQRTARLEERIGLLEAALAHYTRCYGESDVSTIAAEVYLANTLTQSGDAQRAEALFRRARDGYRSLGQEWEWSAISTSDALADLLYTQGKFAEAELYEMEVVSYSRRHQPGMRSHLLQRLCDLAVLRGGQERYSEAEDPLREALAIIRGATPSENDLSLTRVLTLLGWVLLEEGRAVDAEPLLREALSVAERSLTSQSVDAAGHVPMQLLRTKRELGECLTALGRYDEALELLRSCQGEYEDMIPEGSPHRWLLFDTKSRIGGTLLAQGRSFLQTDRRAAAGLFGQAEPSLEEGFREMRPPREVWAAKQKAGERLIALYEAWDTAEPNKGYDQKAGEWRAELAKWQVSTQPASPSAETPSTLLDSTAPSTRSPAPASGSDPSAAPGGDNGR